MEGVQGGGRRSAASRAGSACHRVSSHSLPVLFPLLRAGYNCRAGTQITSAGLNQHWREIMPKMRVVQVPRPNGPLEIVERDIPDPRGGSVRIKVEACGIC